MLEFIVVNILDPIPKNKDAIFLYEDNWDDFGFRSTFNVYIFRNNKYVNIGSTKFGSINESNYIVNSSQFFDNNIKIKKIVLPETFTVLPLGIVSLGQDLDYYIRFNDYIGQENLALIHDLVFSDEYKDYLDLNYDFFKFSLNRYFSESSYEQVKEYLNTSVKYESYKLEISFKNLFMDFKVNIDEESVLPSNVHAVIGRNGVGKTKFLESILFKYSPEAYASLKNLQENNIAIKGIKPPRVIYITTSIFSDISKLSDLEELKHRIHYVGFNLPNHAMHSVSQKRRIADEITTSIFNIFIKHREKFLVSLLRNFDSDDLIMNIANKIHKLELSVLNENILSIEKKAALKDLYNEIIILSSGHFTVLYTICSILNLIEQKALILIDEPETHLHPPMVSTLIKCINELCRKYNGLSIIATHSPVVIQEIPSNCVWKLFYTKVERPTINTFGENVGIITRDVYQLEVEKSGFVDFIARTRKRDLDRVKEYFGSEAIFEYIKRVD